MCHACFSFGLLAILSAHSVATAQNQPAASPEDQPLLERCSDKNPPPCYDKPPTIVHHSAPEYPKNTRKIKGQDSVVLDLIVGRDGLGHDVHVLTSLGPGFDEEAIKAVKQWIYRPATSEGKPVAAEISVQIVFRLR